MNPTDSAHVTTGARAAGTAPVAASPVGHLPGPPPSGTSRSGTGAVLRLFLCRLFADRRVWALPVTAFAVVGALALSVAGGASYFWSLSGETAGFYLILSVFALMLLVFPMVSLAGSAARLLARRRDERISSLRLLGAGQGTVRTLAVVEAGILAAVGSAAGVALYAVLLPLSGLIRFGGGPIGVHNMWLGTPGVAIVLAVLLAIGAGSSLAGLRRIEITPLGVRTRQRPQRVSWWTVLVAVVAIGVAQLLARAGGAQDMLVILVVLLAVFGLPMLALHFIGPWLVGLVTRWRLRRARTAQALVAARNVLESPQQAWRQIGGVAVATYIGVVGGAGFSMVNGVSADDLSTAQSILIADIRAGVLLTMLIAFALTACSVGITQAAQVLDRGELYRGLGRLGMTAGQLESIRRRSVFGPLWIVLVFTLAAAVLTALPVLGAAIVVSPVSVAVVAATLTLGVVLVGLGVLASRPTLLSVLAGR